MDQCCLFAGPFGIPKSTVDYVERIAEFVEVDGARLRVIHLELDDGWWINYPSISLAEAACSCCDWLLSNDESIMKIAVFGSAADSIQIKQ